MIISTVHPANNTGNGKLVNGATYFDDWWCVTLQHATGFTTCSVSYPQSNAIEQSIFSSAKVVSADVMMEKEKIFVVLHKKPSTSCESRN